MNRVTLYILKCDNGMFYTGITRDLKKRLFQHRNCKSSSFVKRRNLNFDVVYTETFGNWTLARKKEKYYKKMNREKLKKIIKSVTR